MKAVDILKEDGISASCQFVDRVKPMSENLLKEIDSFDRIVTVEENAISGGFGSVVLEHLGGSKKVFRIGVPDTFIEHGKREFLLDKYGMSPEKIAERVKKFLKGQGDD